MHTLKEILFVLQSYGDKLSEQNDVIDALSQRCQDMLREGYISDNDPSLEQVWNLKRQHAKLSDKRNARAADLHQTKERLGEFHDAMEQTTKQLEHVMTTCDAQKPVGGDVAAIKQLQADFKVWIIHSFVIVRRRAKFE